MLFNQKGHELESLGYRNVWKQIYVELLHVDRFEPEDYTHFSLKLDFGDMYLHYAELGKQILDVFNVKDEHVTEENIRPLKYIYG